MIAGSHDKDIDFSVVLPISLIALARILEPELGAARNPPLMLAPVLPHA